MYWSMNMSLSCYRIELNRISFILDELEDDLKGDFILLAICVYSDVKLRL